MSEPQPGPKKKGRPLGGGTRSAIWTEDDFELVLDEIRAGQTVRASLVAVFGSTDDHRYKRFFEYMRKDPAREARYVAAVECQCEWVAEEILAIADNPRIPAPDKAERIKARQWLLGRRYNRKYGPKTEIQHSGTGTIRVELAGGLSPADVFESDGD